MNCLRRFPMAAVFPRCSRYVQGVKRFTRLQQSASSLGSVLWGSMKPVHICKSTTLCMYIQNSDRRGEQVYPGLETAAVDEIRKIRPEQRSWSDDVVHCVNHSLYFRLLRVLKVKHMLKYCAESGP